MSLVGSLVLLETLKVMSMDQWAGMNSFFSFFEKNSFIDNGIKLQHNRMTGCGTYTTTHIPKKIRSYGSVANSNIHEPSGPNP